MRFGIRKKFVDPVDFGPLKIRLQRFGRSKFPFYNIVVAQSRFRRNGKSHDVLENNNNEKPVDTCLRYKNCIIISKLYIYAKLTLIVFVKRFYFIGTSDNVSFSVLQIDRTVSKELCIIEDPATYSALEIKDLIRMIDTGNQSTGGLTFIGSMCGIVGFVRFLNCFYVYTVTRIRVVAKIGGNEVFSIEGTRLLPLDEGAALEPEEQNYLRIFSSVDLTKNFYLSYSYDLTHTLQQHVTKPEADNFDDMFVWNYSMWKHTVHNPLWWQSKWFIPVIHGFISQNELSVLGKKVILTLIARRSRHFAGARFHKRGVNEKGYVANEVETEQIVCDCGQSGKVMHYSSYVQHRGSIPLFWSQDTANMSPKPPIHITSVDPFYVATGVHFNRLLHKYGAPICIINLIKHREKIKRESLLLEEFSRSVNYLNQFLPERAKLRYIGFDMSRASKNKDADVIAMLELIAKNCISETDVFVQKDELFTFQHGVLRTNCIDCLDRTNAAQFVIGKIVLGIQLFRLGVISSPELSFDSVGVKMLMQMYHDHGDVIALQYGGSALVNTMETYQKTNLWTSQSRDMIETLKRYYSNSFTDSEKQNAINLFLGNYRVDNGKISFDLSESANEKKQGNYTQWCDANLDSMIQHDINPGGNNVFQKEFDSIYSRGFFSFNNELSISRSRYNDLANPFSWMKPAQSSQNVLATENTASDVEKKDYPADSSAHMAINLLNPRVPREELNEYTRYISQFHEPEHFVTTEDTAGLQYNADYYSQYLDYRRTKFAEMNQADFDMYMALSNYLTNS